MRKYVLKRILMMLLLVIGMTFIVFASLYIAPGDPAELVAGVGATEEDIERVLSTGNIPPNSFLKATFPVQ